MWTHLKAINKYLKFLAAQTKDDRYLPDNYFDNLSMEEMQIERSIVFNKILEGCYEPKTSGFYFSEFILGDLDYAGMLGYRYNSLVRDWDKLVLKHDHLAIMSSRSHGKTAKFSIIEPLRRTYLFPNHKVLIEGATAEQVEDEIIATIKKIVKGNEILLAKLAKKGTEKWTTSYIAYNHGYIIGKGYGSEVRGKHLDYIVCDDVLRTDNRSSDRAIASFLFEVLEPMILVRKGQVVLVGTPLSETDIFSEIKEKSQHEDSSWHFEVYPAILDYDKKILQSPDRFTFDELMQKRIDQGAWRFEKEFQCTGKSLIMCVNNLKKIEDIKENDLVLTHSGVLRKVTKKFKRNYSGEMIRLKTYYYNQELDFTPEHPFFIYRNGKEQWTDAKNLTKDDYLIYPLDKKTNNIKYLNLENYLDIKYSFHFKNKQKYLTPITNGTLFSEKELTEIYKDKDKLSAKQLANKYNVKRNSMYWILNKLDTKNYSPKNSIISKIKITEDLCKLFGYYLAEGSCRKLTTCFSFHMKEREYIDEVKLSLKKYFGKISGEDTNEKCNSTTVYCNSKIISNLFQTLLGKGARKKFIHSFIKGLEKKYLKKIIEGYLNGDGCEIADKKYTYATVSERLALDLREISIKCGYINSLRIRKQKPISYILGRKVSNSPFLYVGGLYKFSKSRYGFIKNYKLYSKIKEIKKENVNDITVYNLEVEKDNTYCTPNSIVHNCLFRSQANTLFPRQIIDPALERGRDYSLMNCAVDDDKSYYIGVDLARSGAASADYTVFTILEFDPQTNIRRIVYSEALKGLKIRIQVERVAALAKKFNDALVYVEKNNFGQDFIDMLSEGFNVHVEFVITGAYTTQVSIKKEDLIRFLISVFEHEKIIIPYKGFETQDEMNRLIDELMAFAVVKTPAGNERMEGRPHDDRVISLALANKATQGYRSQIFALSEGEKQKSPFPGAVRKDKESDLVERIRRGEIK